MNDSTKPLRSKLLAVPALKARYLAHVRTLASEWLDWQKLSPVVEKHRALIEKEVESDTRKLASTDAFARGITVPADAAPAADQSDGPGRGRGRRLSLQQFAEQRRNFLLNHAEIKNLAAPRAANDAPLATPVLASSVAPATEKGTTLPPQKAADLFQETQVWDVHLTFTSEQFAAIEPTGGPGAPGGPGGPGGARPGGFGPGMFLGPAFAQMGDQDGDQKLSRDEFRALGEKWFAQSDKAASGKVDADQLREGLNSTFAPPGGPGGPGGFGGRGPGAGGPGGRGGRPGMMLQGPEGSRNGLASAIGIEFKYVHADLEFEGKTFKDVAVRYKGNGTFLQSRSSAKRSLKIDLNEFAKDQNLAGVTKLNLHNGVTDASSMNEVLSHRLFRDAGVPAPRAAYARVYITVPGKHDKQYLGLYSLVENVDGAFTQDRFGTTKGTLLKPVTPTPFADLGDDWAKYKQTYDPKDDLSKEDEKRIIDFCKLVSNADDATFNAKLGEYLDLDEFSRFMAVTVWLSTLDSILGPGQNYYVHLHPKTNKLQFIPWDLDHSFGQFFLAGSPTQREKLSIDKPWQGENKFLARVFKNEEFKKLYRARMEEFSKTIFRPERFTEQVDAVAAAIRPAVGEESEARLARFDTVVAGEAVGPETGGFGGGPGGGRGGGPGGRPPGFPPIDPVKPIKAFVVERAQSVNDQLAGKSEGETVGGFGNRAGGRGPRGGPPGGPGGFGPGTFLANPFMEHFDADRDKHLTRDEVSQGFEKWFAAWDADKAGVLTADQLRDGINQTFMPRGPAGGPPPGQ